MKINGDDIENAKGTASTEIKNLQTEVEGLKTQVGDRDKQLETLKASAGDNADLKKQIEDLQTENATAKATHESELNQLKIDFAVEKALTGAKAKNIKAVKALLELGEAKLDKDGNVKGLDEQIEKLRSGEAGVLPCARRSASSSAVCAARARMSARSGRETNSFFYRFSCALFK